MIYLILLVLIIGKVALKFEASKHAMREYLRDEESKMIIDYKGRLIDFS